MKLLAVWPQYRSSSLITSNLESVWISGTLSKPVVVQGRRNKFSNLKKEKGSLEGGTKALIPQS